MAMATAELALTSKGGRAAGAGEAGGILGQDKGTSRWSQLGKGAQELQLHRAEHVHSTRASVGAAGCRERWAQVTRTADRDHGEGGWTALGMSQL